MKGTNGKKLKMLNCKFDCISDPAANTMQTAEFGEIKKCEELMIHNLPKNVRRHKALIDL